MQTHIRIIIVLVLCIFIAAALPAQRRANFIEIGRMELSQGHYDKAIENLNIGLKINPDDYDGYYLRADAKFRLEDFVGAEEDLSHAIEGYPYRPEMYFYRAMARERLYEFTNALEDYKKALSLDSTNSEIFIRRAITYHSLQQFQLAIEDCNHAERMHSRDETLYLVRGECESMLKEYKEAINDYTTAINKKPGNAGAYIDRGIARVSEGDKDSAMIDFNVALKLDSANAYGIFRKALLEMDEEHYKPALEDLNKVIQLAPFSASAFFNRAILKGKMKDYFGALNDFDKVLSIAPDHILTYYNRANLEFEKTDYAAALEDYGKVINLFPDFIDAYRNRAQVKKAMGDMKGAALDEKAADEIQKLQSTASDSAKYTEGLKLMQMMTLSDDFENAKEVRGKIQYSHAEIQAQPMFSVILFPAPGNKVRVYDTITKKHYGGSDMTLFSKNDSMDALLTKKKFDQLQIDIANSPGLAANYAERGIIFTVLQTYDRALSDFDKAIDLDPNNALAYFSLANTRMKVLELQHATDAESAIKLKDIPQNVLTGNTYELAISDYSQALSLDSGFTYAWYNRAAAKIANNDFYSAIKDLTHAISCDSTFAEAYYNRGLLYILLHENETACVDLSKAGELGILAAYPVIKKYCDK